MANVVVAAKPGGRVLVIDDEPLLRATLQQILGDEGYIVDVASDGAAGLVRAQQFRPDVILLDLMMPTMNGKQFLQALRAEPGCVNLPVLIMTAVQGITTNLALLGVGEVLEKPFDAEDLLSKIALAMYRSGAETVEHLLGEQPTVAAVVATQGVVLLVDPDRGHLQRLDRELSARAFTVVSMTRSLVDLSRLSHALSPVVVAVAAASPHADELLVVAAAPCPVAIYGTRRRGSSAPELRNQNVVWVSDADDAELLQAVELAAVRIPKLL
ncbi:MAG: response regulator [Kofleriaceae bacterium]|nr:response regulator [Kofleriaceae bacterium]